MLRAELRGNIKIAAKLPFTITIKQSAPGVQHGLDPVSMCPSAISIFTLLSVFKGRCHKAIPSMNVTLHAKESLFMKSF